jgi:glutathione S-transferase
VSEITLYGPARAPFTEKVRRALMLKGLDFEHREPSGPEDYRRWSPKTGLLPVLELDGERIADSTDILLRLDEVFPHPPLLSGDPRVASQQRQLEDWVDENLLWHFNRWQQLRRQREARQEEIRRGRILRIGLLRSMLAWISAGGTWERQETAILRGLGDRLDDLLGFLGARPFFYADRPSMADLAVYSILHTMRNEIIPGSARLVALRPAMVDFMGRVERETGEPQRG